MATAAQIKDTVLELKGKGMSNRAIAKELFGKGSSESTVRGILKKYGYKQGKQSKDTITKEQTPQRKVRIFIGDVETSASIVYSFSRFKAFIKPDQVIQEPYMLTWAGKWLGNDSIVSYTLPDFDEFEYDPTIDKYLILELWKILDECDIFVAHNANFDRGWFNQRCIYWNIQPPSPYKVIDTLRELKQICALPSNSLANSANYFELPNRKLDNAGWSLWQRCMEGDASAFTEMETYNIGDIATLEDLYLKIRPFMKNHPNVALYEEHQSPACVVCGSEVLVSMVGKSSYTNLSEFEVLRCKNCGKVNRKRINLRTKEQMKNTLMN